MNHVTSLDIINTMLGVVATVETSDEAKHLAKDIIDRKVKEIHDLMIKNSAVKAGIIS